MKPPEGRRAPVAWFLLSGCMLAALVLVMRPHVGLFHDAILYAAQAVNSMGGALDQDLFFTFGNQDRFSVFSRVYAPLVGWWGLTAANTVLWAAGMALWTASATALAQAILNHKGQAILAVAAALLLLPGYGDQTLGYGENFVTPRPWAEAAGMLAVAGLIGTGRWRTLPMLAVSTLLHPLTALPFLVLSVWLWLKSPVRFALVAALAMGAGLGLGFARVPPFDWMFARVDDVWLALLRDYSSLVFVSSWIATPYAAWLVLPVLSLVLVRQHGDEPLRRLVTGICVVSIGGMGLSMLLADLLANRFFLSLQVWRAGLLLALFGNLLAFRALGHLRDKGRGAHLFVLAMGASALGHLWSFGALPTGLFGAAVVARLVLAGRAAQFVAGALAIAAAAVLLGLLGLNLHERAWAETGQAGSRTLLATGIAALLLWSAVAPARRGIWPGAGAALCLAGAVAVSDPRPAWQKFVSLPDDDTARLTTLLGDRQVYWEAGLPLMWFGLQRPQFYSCRQKGGIVFFRDQALEFDRRARALAPLGTLDFSDAASRVCPVSDAGLSGEPAGADRLRRVCASLPELDLLVLRRALKERPGRIWTLPSAVPSRLLPNQGADDPEDRVFHIYDCADLRRQL